MRVVCDNCGASYKIPDSKLTREVNRATCRKCGHQIVISRAGEPERGEARPLEAESTILNEPGEVRPRTGAFAIGGAPLGGQGLDEVPAPAMQIGAGEYREATVPRDAVRMPPLSAAGPTLTPGTIPPPSAPAPASAHQTGMHPIYAQNTNPGIVPPYAQPQAPPAYTQPPYTQPPYAPAPQALPQPGMPQPGMVQPSGPRYHDPSGDMSLVMMASFGAAIGASVLATSQNTTQTIIGLGIALWSSITSLLVLVTGDRGRREARVFLSMFLALILAGAGAVGFQATGLARTAAPPPPTTPADGAAVADAMDALAEDEEPPPPEEGTPSGTPTPPTTPTEAAPVEASSTPPAEPTPTEPSGSTGAAVASSGSASSGSSSSGSASSGSSSSGSASSGSSKGSSSSGSASSGSSKGSSGSGSASSGSSKGSSSGSSSGTASSASSEGIPRAVLDTMLKSNQNVKKCFVLYKNETGVLPSRVNLTLTIQPSGTCTAASVKDAEYAGSSLDSCLSTAIKGITFPSYEGSAAKSYPYAFVLR